jgi:hypothetical protein
MGSTEAHDSYWMLGIGKFPWDQGIDDLFEHLADESRKDGRSSGKKRTPADQVGQGKL